MEKITNFRLKKVGYIINPCSNKGLQGNVVNQTIIQIQNRSQRGKREGGELGGRGPEGRGGRMTFPYAFKTNHVNKCRKKKFLNKKKITIYCLYP